MNSKSRVVITGHPYAFSYYFRVFDYISDKSEKFFILPNIWLAKSGKIRERLNKDRSDLKIYGLRAASYGGHGLRGLFKGFLPGIFLLLPYLRIRYGIKILYSCSEVNLLTTLFNGLLAKTLGMKYIFFTWQNIEPQKYMRGSKLGLYLLLAKLNLKLADGVICGNKKSEEISNIIGGHDFKTVVCPLSGVDVKKFMPGIDSKFRENNGLDVGDKVVLFYGALDQRKGLLILINAFKILSETNPDLSFKLVVIGTGPESESLKSKIADLNLQNKVILLDWVKNDELPGILCSSDVFVYPSVPRGGWEEQFGYSMAEASACGVPVVSTRTGSINEVVVDDMSGILVEPNNTEQLAAAIFRITSDADLCRQMGEFGREYILKNFSHEIVAQKISQFLYEFIS